jgi:hypothetical protein
MRKKKTKRPMQFTADTEWKVRKGAGQYLVVIKCDTGNLMFAFESQTAARAFVQECDRHGVEWIVSPPLEVRKCKV